MQLDLIQKVFTLPKPIRCAPLSGGANNRVYKLEFDEGNSIVYKQYFQHPNDQRPRLKPEFSFLEYAWKIGIRNIPEPIKADYSANAALYSFLPGRLVRSEDLTSDLIKQKIAFFLKLNKHKSFAAHLPKASEACFSIEDYLRITEGRIDRLKKFHADSSEGKELMQFLEGDLFPRWNKLKECKTALHSKHTLDEKLSLEDQCVTPSDFGFHNALLDKDGKLSFIDFEYAGWDDPCKTISDLFCQPRVPIPEKHFTLVSEAISYITNNPEACIDRLKIIWPVMQMKWCCILLNVFTQIGKNRRVFSKSEEVDRKEKQLRLAKQQLDKIQI